MKTLRAMGDGHVPVWDNPSGQLPGTGIPTGIDSGLYGFAHTKRTAAADECKEDVDMMLIRVLVQQQHL